MPRYLKQRHRTTCGPVALMNASRWANNPISLQNAIEWCNLCSTGTHVADMHNAIIRCGFLNLDKYLIKPTLQDLDKALKQGNIILLNYHHPESGHYILITGKTKCFYDTVNDRSVGPALRRRHRRWLSKYLRAEYPERPDQPYSHVWILAKSNT